nr:hypothetical protein [uncultured Desulfuromonas sp.]
MEEIWKLAISLTGISGVGAFVFLSLYKEWIKAPALLNLTKLQKYKLLRLFLILTFSFAVISLALSAYENYLSSNNTQASSSELEAIAASRYKHGKQKIEEILNSEELGSIDKEEFLQIATQYQEHSTEALNAIKNKQFNLWHEKSNQMHELLRSDKAKKFISPESVNDMVWDPKIEEMKKEMGLREERI